MKQNREFIEVCGPKDSLLWLNDSAKEFVEDLILFFVFMCLYAVYVNVSQIQAFPTEVRKRYQIL